LINSEQGASKKPEKIRTDEEVQLDSEIDEYADTLTTWLCDLLNSLHKNIELGQFDIRGEGVCIRYSPMEHANVYATTEYDLHMFDKSLEDIVTILDASIKCKATFAREIKKFSNLRPVSVARWAGIGAVRYIPEYLLERIEEIVSYSDCVKRQREVEVEDPEPLVKISEKEGGGGPVEKEYDVGSRFDLDKYVGEIDAVNEEIVKKLQRHDGGFSIGMGCDGLKAIKLGMVNDTEAVDKLAVQVQEVGRSIEESSRVR
jgi:hypothetical protein